VFARLFLALIPQAHPLGCGLGTAMRNPRDSHLPRCLTVQRAAVVALLWLLAGTAGFATRAAWASTDYDDIDRLLRARDPVAALARADQALAERPGDPQLQFMRATALSEAGRTDEALAALQRLTQVFPELPEPHNNLAVLYAARGDLEGARASLEMALRLHPDYATALANLGDVQARLALRAWEQARRLDARLSPRIDPKMSRVREALAPAPPRQ
jgi:Flp pilus assembly protein TadD